MTWRCRHCGHETIWWRGACDLCGIPLYGERRRYVSLGRMLGACFAVAADFERQMAKVEAAFKRVPVLDTGIGRALGYADDRAFMLAGAEERGRALALLSVEERARLEAAERELEWRVIHGDGTGA